MAAYIPDSYKSRDFYAGSSAYGQQWSSDDCLSSNFTTEGRKSLGRIERDLAKVRPATEKRPERPAMTPEAIEKRIAQIREKREKKKLQQAAAAQGGAPHMSRATLRAARALQDELVKQATQAFREASQNGDESQIKETKIAMLKAKLERSKLNDVPSTGSKSGKKKKKRVKIELDSADQVRLDGIETKHLQELRTILDGSVNNVAYSQSIHDEFVAYATEKIGFYNSLEQSDAREKKIGIAQTYLKKCQDHPVTQETWPDNVFKEFKEIMNQYRTNVQNLPSGGKSKRVKELRKERTKAIEGLLVKNSLYSREQASARR